jgi:hypothetical protein
MTAFASDQGYGPAPSRQVFLADEGSGRHESARRHHGGVPDETKFKGRLLRR